MARKLRFPVPVVTVPTPTRHQSVQNSWIVWGSVSSDAGTAFSYLSVQAEATGAHEVIGAQLTTVHEVTNRGSFWFLVAYGTAICYA
jgi:hypothetical protein